MIRTPLLPVLLLLACEGDPPELTIQEESVDLGQVKVGELGTGSLTLWNSGDGMLQLDPDQLVLEGDIEDFSLTLRDSADEPWVLGDGERKKIVVAFWPRAKGPRAVQLTLAACGTSERDELSCCGEEAEGCPAFDSTDSVELTGEGY